LSIRIEQHAILGQMGGQPEGFDRSDSRRVSLTDEFCDLLRDAFVRRYEAPDDVSVNHRRGFSDSLLNTSDRQRRVPRTDRQEMRRNTSRRP